MVNFEPPWLTLARTFLGTLETPGTGSNPVVESFHAVTAGGTATDDVPWCSSFLCAMLERSGITDHPRSKASQAWRNWGVGVGPILGSVCVIAHGGGKGHVGLVVGRLLSGKVPLLGGNQSDSVSIKAFPTSQIVGYRWPRAPMIDEPGVGGNTR